MDSYSIKARIYPIALTFFPIVVIGIAYSFQYESYLQGISSFGIASGLTYLFSNLGRDRGKMKEKLLWKKWGGMPSVQVFSFRNDIVDTLSKKRYHNNMQILCPVNQIIDEEFENSNPNEALNTYEMWSNYLRINTRDKSRFPFVFKELTYYGFRRNLFGLKGINLFLIIVLMISNYLFQAILNGYLNFEYFPNEFFISETILIFPFVFWIFIVSESWVKIPAFAYAERLIESSDDLATQ